MSYGLIYRGVSLWRPDGSIRLRIVEGRWFEAPEVRGRNVTVPGASGQRRRNRITDRLPIVMAGHIRGVGVTLDDQRDHYLQLRGELEPVFDSTLAAAGELIETQLDSLGSQKVAMADFVSAMFAEDILGFFCRVSSVELEAVTPPYWTDVP